MALGDYMYYTFTLQDGMQGLLRALRDAQILITHSAITPPQAVIHVEADGHRGEILLTETVASDHPLARFGRIPALCVTLPPGWTRLESILPFAFLRGGG